jgi:hypothetical protein
MGQNVVEQNRLAVIADDLFAYRTTPLLRDEQSKNQCGYGRDQAHAKPHDVFDGLIQMMLRQSAAKQRAKKDAAQDQYEYDE